MSHFTVIVIGDDIDGQMEPYAEQEVKPEYLKFEDIEDESLEEYKNKEVNIVVLADGTLHNEYEDQFRKFDPNNFSSDYGYPEDSVIRKGSFTELYDSFEEYMSEWHSHKSRDDDTGRYGYWHNPNSKFDYYV